MYTLSLLVTNVFIFVLLLRMNGVTALLFLIAMLIATPALVLHRRDVAQTPQVDKQEGESRFSGVIFLLRLIGTDATGIALGSLVLILIVLFVAYLGTTGLR